MTTVPVTGIGIENPVGSYHPIHDEAHQGHGFAYLENIIDATSKVSAILGTFRGQFQVPNIPGLASPGGGDCWLPLWLPGATVGSPLLSGSSAFERRENSTGYAPSMAPRSAC